jgi:WD40 repeat protein
MLKLKNENIIKLIISNYCLHDTKRILTGAFNKVLSSAMIRTLDYEKYFRALGKGYTLLKGHSGMIYSLIAMNNSQIITASKDTKIKIWNINTKLCIKTLEYHSDRVNCVIRLASNLIASCSDDGNINIFNAEEDYNCIKTIPLESGIRKLFMLKGNLACSTFYQTAYSILVFDINNNYNLLKVFKAHPHRISSLVTIGEQFATGSHDDTIKIWNYNNESACLYTLTGHENMVQTLAFDQRKWLLISGSNDKSIKVWDVRNGWHCTETINDAHKDGVLSLLILTNSLFASGSYDKTIKIWNSYTFECVNVIKDIMCGFRNLMLLEDNRLAASTVRLIIIFNY